MAIAITVNTLDDVPEALRDEYAPQADGKFRLKGTEGYEAPEQIRGLKSALQKERENVGNSKKELDKLREQYAGLDPAQLATQKAELDTQRASLQDTIAAAVATELDKAQAPLRAQIAEQQRLNATTEAIDGAKGNRNLLLPWIKQHAVFGDDGKVTVAGTTYDDIAAAMPAIRALPEVAGAFAFSGNSGGGSGGAHVGGGVGGGGNVTPPTRRSRMTVSEKAAFISANGTDAFMQIAP